MLIYRLNYNVPQTNILIILPNLIGAYKTCRKVSIISIDALPKLVIKSAASVTWRSKNHQKDTELILILPRNQSAWCHSPILWGTLRFWHRFYFNGMGRGRGTGADKNSN